MKPDWNTRNAANLFLGTGAEKPDVSRDFK